MLEHMRKNMLSILGSTTNTIGRGLMQIYKWKLNSRDFRNSTIVPMLEVNIFIICNC